jgi:hypothetical protein
MSSMETFKMFDIFTAIPNKPIWKRRDYYATKNLVILWISILTHNEWTFVKQM